jgi:serine/threonine protein kinase
MSRHDAIVGRTLDEKYHVEELLGQGGMGAVYLATHLGTGRLVALKIITPELTKDEMVIERFRREARAAGQLRHPNVVNVTDFGFAIDGEERLAYLVMERLRGQTLADLLERKGTLPLARAVDILQQVCAAVEEAHKHGIVHRDLKPENIWLEPRARRGYDVKVLDFGVAKLREGPANDHGMLEYARELEFPPNPDATTIPGPISEPSGSTLASSAQPVEQSGPRLKEDGITRFGILLGTPFYMSPEQWLQCRVDARSDVYSLGIIAYRMLAGEVPFNGRTSPIALQHIRATPTPLAEKAPSIPAGVAVVVMSALAKDPADRPPSAQSFAVALAASAEGTGAILGRAIALCATHFPSFLGVNARVFGPAILACSLRLLTRFLVQAHLVPERVGAVISAAALGVYMLSMLLLQPVAAALFAPRVRDALLLEPPRPGPTLRDAARCLRGTIVATLITLAFVGVIGAAMREPLLYVAQRAGFFPEGATDFTTLESVLHILMEFPGSALISLLLGRFVAYPSVVTMERRGGRAALRRSTDLTRPFRRGAAAVLGLHLAVRYVTVWVFWLALAQLARVSFLTVIDISNASMITDVGLLLSPSIQIVCWTFTFTAMALLYFKGRQMEGVTLDAMDDADAAEGAPNPRRTLSSRPPPRE